MNNDQNLEARVADLERRLNERDRQQIKFPLDPTSVDILNNYFMRLTSAYTTTAGAGGHTFVTYIGTQKDLGVFSPAVFSVGGVSTFQYTVSAATDIATLLNGVTIVDGQRLFVETSDTAPTPLVVGDTYFAIGVTSTTFKFSLDGVTPIDITDSGTGDQFVTYF